MNLEFTWPSVFLAVMLMNMTPLIATRLVAKRNPQAFKRALTIPNMSPFESISYWAIIAPYFLMFPYALFVPFTDNPSLLLLGAVIYGFGLVLRTKAMLDYAATPAGELIDHGVYRLSRNPGYFAATLTMLGIGLMGSSVLMMAVSLYFFVGYQWFTRYEERFCLQHWPDDYPIYKQQVAKNLLFF